MRADRIGRLLLAAGLLVGTAAGIGLLIGFEPARLPRALLNIAAYKLTFLAAFGLLATGAVLRRYARRDAHSHADVPPATEQLELTEGESLPHSLRAKQRERVPIPSPREKDDR